MCRLCLATFTDSHIPKAELVHECMMRSSHDDLGQKDGWGITDMQHSWRSLRWYFEDIPFWKNQIDQSGFILSHLRKASGGTGRTVLETHPYVFNVNDDKFTAVHNGFFGGTTYVWKQDRPNTDSYRALENLAHRTQEANELSAGLMTEWLDQYNDDSHYAVMVHWRDAVHIVRGKTRHLAALQVGNGYLIHTSIQMLHMAKIYLKELYEIDVPAPEAIPDNTYVRLTLGTQKCEIVPITPVHKSAYGAGWHRDTTALFPNSPAASARTEESGDSGNVIVAPSVTTPRVVKEDTALAAFDYRSRRIAWSKISGKLSPMRRDLAAMWACSVLGYMTEALEPDINAFYNNATELELKLLDMLLFPIDADTGKYDKPFSSMAMLMLNWWNHIVLPGHDSEVHTQIFDLDMFWLDPNFARKDPISGMRAWTRYIMHLFGTELSEKERARHLDISAYARECSYINDPPATIITESTALILKGS